MWVYFLIGYVIGSIPFGLILSKLAGHGDIREIGSGNIGATNVLRTGNKALAAATLLFDATKGAIAICAATFPHKAKMLEACKAAHNEGVDCFSFTVQAMTPFQVINSKPEMYLLIGLGAIIGHCFPVWLKFKGGKGVATTLGVLLAAVPMAGLAACATWFVTALIFRISSLAALMAMVAAPVVTFFVYGQAAAAIALLITLLVFIRHKDNIKRLMKGEEPKIGKKKKETDEPAEATE